MSQAGGPRRASGAARTRRDLAAGSDTHAVSTLFQKESAMRMQRLSSSIPAAGAAGVLLLVGLAFLTGFVKPVASSKAAHEAQPPTPPATTDSKGAKPPSPATNSSKAAKPSTNAGDRDREASPAFSTAPRQQTSVRTGNSYPKLLPMASGTVTYRGVDVRYLFLQQPGVPRLAFVAPVDIARDEAGRLNITLQDPVTNGDFAFPQGDGTWKRIGPQELAQAVAERKIDRDTKVLVTIEFDLHSDTGIRDEVFCAAMDQIQHEARQKPAEHWLVKMDTAEARRKVTILPAREFRIRCATKGLEDVAFVWEKYPTLREKARMTTRAEVPARFLAALYSSAGADLVAEYRYDGFDERFTRLLARDFVDELINQFLKETGKGEHRLNETDAKVLITRDKVQKLQRNSRWVRNLIIYGNDPALMGTLFELFQRVQLDLFAATEQQVVDYLRETLDWIKVQEKPSYIDLFKKVDAKEELTEKDYEEAHGLVHAVSKARGGGGGFQAVFKGVPFGANGEFIKFDAKAVARTDELKEAYRNAASMLSAVQKGGHVEIPKDLDLLLVDTKELRRDLTTHLEAILADEIQTLTVSSPFNSARRTLVAQTGGTAPANPEIERMIPRLAPPPPKLETTAKQPKPEDVPK